MDYIPTRENPKLKINFTELRPDDVEGIKATKIKKIPLKKTGTTTVALKIKDGVVIAADNRATMGMLIANKNAKKVHQIQPYIYMTIAGGVADALYLIDLLRAETEIYNLRNESRMGVNQAAKLLQNILYNKKGWYQVGHLVGGYTEKDGAKIYNLGGYGSMLEEDYASVGSGSRFALGILETEWKKDLSREEGIKLAIKAVRSAIQRDIASGNGIDVAAVQKGQEPWEKSYSITDQSIIDNTFEV